MVEAVEPLELARSDPDVSFSSSLTPSSRCTRFRIQVLQFLIIQISFEEIDQRNLQIL